MLEGLRRAASAAAAAEFLQAHGHRLLTPEATAPDVLRELQAAAEVRASRCPVPFVKANSHCVCCCAPVHHFFMLMSVMHAAPGVSRPPVSTTPHDVLLQLRRCQRRR